MNKFQTKVTAQEQKRYSDYLIDVGFLGLNKLFVLLFKNNGCRARYTRYYPKSPLKKLKRGIKNGIEVTLKLSSNVAGDSNDEKQFCA